jgi:hypothetical protein
LQLRLETKGAPYGAPFLVCGLQTSPKGWIMLDLNQKVAKLQQFASNLPPEKKSFAESLAQQFGRRGSLSEKQMPYVDRLLADIDAKINPASVPARPKVANFHRIIGIFDNAKQKGYKKKIKLRFGDKNYKVALSEAPHYGVNAGMVYVTLNEEYKGKISREGSWEVSGGADDKLRDILSEFVMDPLKVAKKYGFKTGNCCCCGQVLTDPNSIAAGIGPVCADKFF